MCDDSDASAFYMCTDKFWTKMQCDGENLCYEGFWSNSTCDKGNVCGMKQGSALCHDPDQPIIDVPDQPCNKDKASQCVSGNETLYQVCSNKLWTNLTCDGNNICRMKDDKVMCVDKDEAYMSLTQLTMHEPTPYKGMLSLGVSARDAYSWGTSVLLGAIAITFGVGL
ncbi:hypothetical protein IW145_000575 [Coemansia sp. RSA 521]|nr:hypothetical protein IW145_000575 [Coemansia sp. RSA 521]